MALGYPSAPPLNGCSPELRNDLVPVCAEDVLLAVGHEVDVEVVDTDGLELLQLRRHRFDVADDREAVADLIGDELAVSGPFAAGILGVVDLPRLDVVGELGRDIRVLAVALD